MNGAVGTSNQFSESDEAELAAMLATELQEAEQAWRGFDLTARVKELEEQKALAATNQTDAIIRRKKIAEQTKNFRALSREDQLKSIGSFLSSILHLHPHLSSVFHPLLLSFFFPSFLLASLLSLFPIILISFTCLFLNSLGQLVKSYQIEIDLLSKRSQAAETTLTELSSRISGINDPSTVFAAVNQELAKASGSSLLAPSFSTSWAVLTGRGGGGEGSGTFLDDSFSIPPPASSSGLNGGNMVSEEAHNNLKEKTRVLEIDFKTERKEKEEMEKKAANELAKLQVELIENKKKLEEALTQNVELKSKTARAGTSIKQLQGKAKELTEGLQRSQKEKEEFKKKAEEMMQKHDEMLDEVEGKSRRIAGLKTELEKARKSFDELKEER
jgi:DNA repair exonuclease SbcCD ATPase subunit